MDFYEIYSNHFKQIASEIENIRIKKYNEFKKGTVFYKIIFLILFICIICYIISIICYILLIFYIFIKPIFDPFYYKISLDYIALYFYCSLGFLLPFALFAFLLHRFYSEYKNKAYYKFRNTYNNEKLKKLFKQQVLAPLNIDFYNYPSLFTVHSSSLPPERGMLSYSYMEESGLFSFTEYNPVVYSVSQELKGKYKEVNFLLSELKKCDTYDYNKYESYTKYILNSETYMLVITLDYNKKTKNRTIVSTKNAETSKSMVNIFRPTIALSFIIILFIFIASYAPLVSIFDKILAMVIMILLGIVLSVIIYSCYKYFKKIKEMSLNKIILENPKFNKKYNVYSSSQVEARYHLTPAFMDRLYNLQTTYGSDKLKCSFFNNTLMIAIYTKKDLFEVCNLFKPTKDVISDFYKEINAIYQIIDALKLDEQLYLK